MRGQDASTAMIEVPAFHICRYRKTSTSAVRRKRILILYFQVLSSRSSTPSILQTQLRSTSVPIVAGCPFKQINYRLKDMMKRCTRTVAPLVTINPEQSQTNASQFLLSIRFFNDTNFFLVWQAPGNGRSAYNIYAYNSVLSLNSVAEKEKKILAHLSLKPRVFFLALYSEKHCA